MNVNEANVKKEAIRILEAIDILRPLEQDVGSVKDSKQSSVSYSIREQLDDIYDAVQGILGEVHAAYTIDSSGIKSAKAPSNVHLNEDTKKLLDKLEKKVGHELKIKFLDGRENGIPYVTVEKILPNGKWGVTEGYLDRLSEDLLFDGYSIGNDANELKVFLDPSIMYTMPLKSSKSAIECFPVSEEEAKDIDNLKETFKNKSDLRAVLEDYFHIYDDWSEITPTEFDTCFKEFIGSAFFEQGKECVVEINENGKWEMVSLDNTPEGWSTKKAAKIFPDENTARKSALIKRLASAGYSESNGNLRISER